MYATMTIKGKTYRYKVPPELAKAQRANRGKKMTNQEVIDFVEAKRREAALRHAKPYLESRS